MVILPVNFEIMRRENHTYDVIICIVKLNDSSNRLEKGLGLKMNIFLPLISLISAETILDISNCVSCSTSFSDENFEKTLNSQEPVYCAPHCSNPIILEGTNFYSGTPGTFSYELFIKFIFFSKINYLLSSDSFRSELKILEIYS